MKFVFEGQAAPSMKATVEAFSIPSQQSFSDRRWPRYLMVLIRASVPHSKKPWRFILHAYVGVVLKQYAKAFVRAGRL